LKNTTKAQKSKAAQQQKLAAKKAVKAPMVKMATRTAVKTPVAKAPMMKPGIAAKPMMPVKNTPANNDNVDFAKGDYVVYPAHGVGQVEGVETQTIAGMQISLYAIAFEKDRMRLKIPVMKAKATGLRKLCNTRRFKDALETLQGRSRVRRTMWSRRAQEYELKINSGDPVAIAEVLRDLKRSNDDSEQSYSERQIYQSALERLAREYAAIKKIPELKATEQLEDILGTNKKKQAA
jgi:CarD family transcriptional regulator